VDHRPRATDGARPRELESLTGRKLKLYVLADPAPGDDGDDDRGRKLVAWDDDAATAVAATPRLKGATSGYKGTRSDPWRQLERKGKLRRFDARQKGNVYQGARTALDGRKKQTMTLAIGFGAKRGKAEQRARKSLRAGFAARAGKFDAGWKGYLGSLADPPAPVASDPELKALYDQSLMVLAASEDKRFRGASIAAPSMPWEWGVTALDDKPESGPYHLVWPRDFYHVATAQKAAGDDAAATRLLDYLWEVQKDDGSWWQNTRVNGQEYWTSLQLDETALPVVLAWWLGRTSAADWRHVEKAADFIVQKGPQTEQERWENRSGWSPNTIATEIAGLITAADIARKHGATAKAAAYEAKADEWQAKVKSWTATTTGPYSPKPYYLRVTKPVAEGQGPDPDVGTTYGLGDNRPEPVDQREIVDNSFLGLTLFGVKKWDDPVILNSLAVGESLGVDTPSGRIYHRFTFDGYGETDAGGDWTIFPEEEQTAQTHGRLWPLLTGERGEYELLAGRSAATHLQTIANSANDGLMLPEQVWDKGPEAGENTRSATPLAWTHAQFVRLAWSIAAGEPIERPGPPPPPPPGRSVC
jgi:glucoamylase